MSVPDLSPPYSKRSRCSLRRCKAFSLVEVVLALGITATALLVIFSLMPLGLASLQDTQRQIVETEIYNKVGSELGTTPLYIDPSIDPKRNAKSLIDEYCASKRFPIYFDTEGNELPDVPNRLSRAVFVVRCAGGVPDVTTWSPTTAKGELRYGTVMIGFRRDPNVGNPPADSVRKRSFLLSNHGS